MISTAFIILLCAGCRPDPEGFQHLALTDAVLDWTDAELMIMAGMAWEPSEAVIEALDHGVVVPIRVTTRTSRHHGWVARFDRDRNHRFEIRYLPLVRSYQITETKTGQQQSFPRLGMLLDSLAQRQAWSTGLGPDEARQGRWQVQIRAELDRTRLPSPMRLPVWFDPEWRAVTDWQTWMIDGG